MKKDYSVHAYSVSAKNITPRMLKNSSSLEIQELLSGVLGDFLYTVLCSATVQAGLADKKCRDALLHAAVILRADDFNCIRRYKGSCSFKAYLAAVCVDIVHDFTAACSHGEMPSESGQLFENAGIRKMVKANKGIFDTARAILDEELAALPADERIALRMRFEQKMGYHDINMLLGMKNAEKRLGAVFSKLKRSMEKKVGGIRGIIP